MAYVGHFWDIFVDTAESDGREVAGFVAISSGGVMAVMMFVVRVLSRALWCTLAIRSVHVAFVVCVGKVQSVASCIVAVFVFCVGCANGDSGGISAVVFEL